ncbi:ThuA domain-containing protein [Paraflavitalea soli]|uniref:ThuA domain-containing protein n=1 Tax=Paraflavitalea soli TaxID=2315862 RepID=A0A3B7MDV0_9BACT|nr:ThuA domain-containing protein [Paraflavitalea soli]AXY72484.1 ThuA domain-containing protein [Paraflavitalea soli]
MNKITVRTIVYCVLSLTCSFNLTAQNKAPLFKVIGFFTAKSDQAHISYVHEANKWLAQAAADNHFTYDSTNNWSNLNAGFLSQYQVVLFLDTRPESADQRRAFQEYMEKGGGWIGFHFAAFALTPSAFPENWDWYHNQFIGAGQYKSNTWRPTSAVLRVEDRKHPFTQHLPATFSSAPNEWYRWEKDLRKNPDIKILLSIDSTSFPLGTGPKQHEIWHSGYYPVAWTNTHYKMLYVNMGHNDIDYENKTNKELSFTFANQTQNKFILNALLTMGKAGKATASSKK